MIKATRAVLSRSRRITPRVSPFRSQTSTPLETALSLSRVQVRRNATKPPHPTAQTVPTSTRTIPGPSWLWLEPIYEPFRAYGRVHHRKPYTTQFVSALVIYFMGDIVAQSISGELSEEVEEDVELGWMQKRDWARTSRALIIGGLAAIPGYKWFLWLSNSFNYRSKLLSITAKVVVSQILFTPIFNSYFFGMQTLLTGATLPEIIERIKHTVPVSWINSCKVWPAVTAFSFTFIPLHFRSIFGGVIAIGWQTYLSLLNQQAAKDEAEEHAHAPAIEHVQHVEEMHESKEGDKFDVEKLRSVAQQYNITIPPSEEEHYRHLLNGLDATATLIDELPEYIEPRLLPSPSTLPRTYTKLGGNKEKNPLNGWSHYTTINSTDPLDKRLEGRTIAVKDNVSVAGIPLTGGTFPELLAQSKEYPIPKIDAVVVKRVLESGAIVKGSANCEHFSMSPLSFTSASGPVHNAWLHGYTTGGSSSGCGALVGVTQVRQWRKKHGLLNNDEALGEGADMAIGGDQGGSIRIPAAYAGIYGFKATHGLIPYTGIISLLPIIDNTGPMTATLEDNMLLLSVLAGYDGMDPRCTPETPLRKNVLDYSGLLAEWTETKKSKSEWSPESSGRGLRVGVIKEGLEVMGLSEEVKNVIEAAAAQFKAVGAEVEEISVPMHILGPAIWTVATRPGMVPYGLQNQPTPYPQYTLPDVRPATFDQKGFEILNKHNPATVNMFFNSAFLNSRPDVNAMVGKALNHVQQLRDAYDDALKVFDVLLTPVNPRVGSKHPDYNMNAGEKMNPAIGATLNTCQFNVTGHPALSMPAGWGKVPDGPGLLPVGMQLVAKRFDELSIFKAAAAWELGGKGLDKWNGQLN
ncbi:amidase signature enzyme [Amniculicola lignicola CBS 123094]|uniref:Amidase signature enzyme n=1 Tax=Amniculicola lignicola CBS 123094 TaxID=1392246 RepID=A0A6A5WPL5_9PLEO|nr:amidase signature enzyme [Amniculicola lignicola CBS 123094]